MKSFNKLILFLYLIVLIWLVLFKFSFNIFAVLEIQKRSINLIPFTDPLQNSLKTHIIEILLNFIVFIPFGILLSINLNTKTLRRKLSIIIAFSLGVEITQFILGIGISDITDLITNTTGGLIGIKLYDFTRNYIDKEKLDKFIVSLGIILLLLFLILRILFLRVRYQAGH